MDPLITTMRKNLTKAAMLACTLALSLAPMSVAAAPTGQGTEAQADGGLQETQEIENMGTEDGMEEDFEETMESAENVEVMDGAEDTDEAREGSIDEADEASDTADTADGNGDTASGTPAQTRMTAEQLKAEKGGGTAATGVTLDDGDEEDSLDGEDSMDNKPAYTAPEDTRHANVSFSFNEEAASAYFSKLTYPLTLGLKEVDTGKKVSLTIKSEGQILEVDKGDYAVTSLKDSGKIPLSIAADTLHIYENTEYPVRFAANSALKMLTDFFADNIFLGVFLVFAAIFYQKAVIPRFASDARRR